MNIFNHDKIQELIDYGYNFDIGAYFSEGIDLVKKEVGLFIGYTIVYFLIAMVAGFIPMASLLIGPPLIAGYFLASHKVSNNEILDFGDFFKGFDYFAQLLIQQLIYLLIVIVLFVPILLIFGTSLFMLDANSMSGTSVGIVGMFVILLVMIGVIYISVSYIFAPLFILFGDMQAWDSMEASRKIVAKNFFPVFGLLLLIMLINIIGMIPCFLGLVFTLPASYAIIYVAFKELVDLDSQNTDHDVLDHLVD